MKKITLLLSIFLIPFFGFSQCLLDKDAGSDPADRVNLANDYNKPSPYAYGDMFGVNDAGQFQGLGQKQNPIRFLTTKMRAFRAMDYDFNQGLQFGTPYASLTKPKDVNGFPQFLGVGNGNYDNFVNHQGITSISSATEILNKDPLTWKEKIWNESDWWPSGSGLTIPQQIEQSYENYTTTFLDRYGDPNNVIVDYYQVGNELWDYPIEEDYHAMMQGAHNAFVAKYGADESTWPVKLMPGSFQAFTRDNICTSSQRDFSNCGSSVDMFNQIGDYLNIGNCTVLEDLHAINIHSYPFDEGTLDLVHPEKPNNEFLGFIASLAFRDSNPLLKDKGIWLTETGYDSWNVDNGSGLAVGVGELTQAAYILRMYMITSRYHMERVDFYMAFDLNRTTNIYHGDYYSSSGFWELGLHPVWNSGSADPAHGANPKASFFSLYEFQTMFKTKVFYEAVAETNEVYAYIIAEPDGSDAYLVFWNPTHSEDNTLFNQVSVNQAVTLPNNYAVSSNAATFFATTGDEVNEPYTPTTGNTFNAVTGTSPGATTIINATRMPAYIKLTGAPCTGANISVTPNTISATITAGNVDFINVLSGATVVGTICSSTATPCSNGSTNNATVTPGTYTVEIGYSDGTTCQSTVVVPGSCVDMDNDNVCAAVDCDDNNPNIPTTPGTVCDDGNPATSGDVIQGDGCTCLGIVPPTGGCDTTYVSCTGVNVTVGSGTVSVDVTGTDLEFAKIMLPDYTLVDWFCAAWLTPTCTNGLNAQATVAAGTYIVQVQYLDGTVCQIDNISVIVSDNDGDGVCTAEDCDDNDPNVPTTPGTSCDDGDPNTSNDEIQADGCTCLGTGCGTDYTDCNGGVISAGSNSISVTINAGDVDYVKVMNPDYTLVDWLCATWLTSCSNGTNPSLTVNPGTYLVQFQYSDGTLCDIQSVVVGGSGSCGDPDLSVVATVIPANVQGVSTVSTVIKVSEVAGYDTEGSMIKVRVPSDDRYNFIWDPGLTQIGFNIVDNTAWNYTGDNGIFHNFEFSGVLSASNSLSFGFIGFYDPQNTNGQTTISVTVVPFSGGETNPANNADSELLIYFQ